MKFRNIFKLTFSQIYNRRYMFFLSVVTLLVMFFYLDYMTYLSFENYYEIWKANDTLAEKDFTYLLKFNDMSFWDTSTEKGKEFIENVKEKFPNTGGSYTTSINLEKFMSGYWENALEMSLEDMSRSTPSYLIIDSDIAGLCNVTTENGKGLTEIEGKDGHIPVLVGSNYKNQVKEGEILEGYLSDDTYQVVGFLEKGGGWIGRYVYDITSVDDVFITVTDKEFTEEELQRVNGGGGFYIFSDRKKEEIDRVVQEIAGKMNISVSVLSQDEVVSDYKVEHAENIRFAMIVLLIGVVVVALTSLLNSVMGVIERKKDYIIMNVCGVSFQELFKIICMENIIKMVLPLGLAIFIMNKLTDYQNEVQRLEGFRNEIADNRYMYIQGRAIIVMVIYMLVLLVSCSLASLWYLKKVGINKAGGMFND